MARPKHANVIIKMSGVEVSKVYKNFVSLSLTRNWGDTANSFELKLIDETAYEIESIILGGDRNISLTYYETGEDGVEVSKNMSGYIWDYDISFVNNLVILNLSGTCGVNVGDTYTIYNRLWNTIINFNTWDLIKGVSSDEAFFGYGNSIDWLNIIPGVGNLLWLGLVGKYISDNNDGGVYYEDPELSVEDLHIYTVEDNDGNVTYKIQKVDINNPSIVSDPKDDPSNFIECSTMYLPVRPSDIVKLIINGGKYEDLFDSSIDYDDFYDQGFAFSEEAKNYNKSSSSSGTVPYSEATDMQKKAIKYFLKLMGTVEGHAGWEIGEIEKTKPVMLNFSQTKKSDLSYIQDVLINHSISEKTGNASYQFYFIDNKAYFKAINLDSTAKATVILGQYYPNIKKTGGATYSGGDIISFTHKAPLSAYIAGGSSTSLQGFNFTTGENINTEGLSSAESTEQAESQYIPYITGKVATLPQGKSSGTIEEFIAEAANNRTSLQQLAYQAELTIKGNMKLECGNYIELINLPSKGSIKFHHTSGMYLIYKIEESITKGTYQTKLYLVKNASSVGVGSSVSGSSGTTNTGGGGSR